MEVIAHRGASAHRPEHTLAAYDVALAQGADMLELDVRATADGALLVVHDPTLLRTAGVPRRVDRLTLAQVRAACGPAAPLTLDAVLGRYGAGTRYLVELKDPAPGWEEKVPAALLRHGVAAHATVQSFDVRALRRLHAGAPWLACAPLYRARRRGRTFDALRAFACGVGVWHREVDAALVAAAHARGLAVRAWTVNDPAAIARLAALGVDGVITDAPDVAVGVSRPRPAPALAA